MKDTVSITNGGNLLRHCKHGFYFQKPNGEFIREVVESEAMYLTQNCLSAEVSFINDHPEFFPQWKFVKSVVVTEDYTNYKPETSRNGGNYSFHVNHDWYAAKFPDGTCKFCFVESHTTSAEFPFDELTGVFQSDLGDLVLGNAQVSYQTQGGKEWDYDIECFIYLKEDVLEKVATMADFFSLWNESYQYLPPRDEDEQERSCTGLTFSEKKEVVSSLRAMGCERPTKNKRRSHKYSRR